MCATDGRFESMTREEFAAYAHEAFDYHNKIVNDVIVTASFLDDG